MSKELFESIEQEGLLNRGRVNLRKIKKLSLSKIVDFAQRTQELTLSDRMNREKTLYSFSSSFSLDGGIYPCSTIRCRLKNATKLSQFSALYGDKIYINYYPNDFAKHPERLHSNEIESIQNQLANDLSVLSYLRPLIEAQKIVPITHLNSCPQCLAEKSFGSDADRRFNKISRHLSKRYSEEITVTLEKDNDLYIMLVRGSEELLEHGGGSFRSTTPFPDLQKHLPEIFRQVERGKKVTLLPTEVRKSNINRFLTQRVFDNTAFELASAQSLNTSYLTDRTLDIDVIRSLSGDSTINERNQIIQKYLTCIVPFVEAAKPEDLLKIRQQEADAFIIFRNALNQFVDEYRKQGKAFTENDARQIFGDIIEPKLAQLNTRVKAAEKSLLKSTAYKIIGWTGAISFGWYAGLLPTDLVNAATALGLIKVVAELTESTLTKSHAPDTIRDEPMYFLWRVRETMKENH